MALGCNRASKQQEAAALNISKEKNMLIAERFIADLVRIHGRHPVSTDGGTWYPQACRFLRLSHHIHSSLEKSLIERTMHASRTGQKVSTITFPVS